MTRIFFRWPSLPIRQNVLSGVKTSLVNFQFLVLPLLHPTQLRLEVILIHKWYELVSVLQVKANKMYMITTPFPTALPFRT